MRTDPRFSLIMWAGAALFSVAAAAEIPRTDDDRPDFSGTYDVSSLTPFTRDPDLGEKREFTQQEVDELKAAARERVDAAAAPIDPEREPLQPLEGEARERGVDRSGSYTPGSHDYYWFDCGGQYCDLYQVDGAWRTSIVIDPPDGQLPAISEAGTARQATLRPYYKAKYPGEAWWLADGGDPYDNPESMSVGDRCLYMSLTVPVRPSAYNNMKTIVQSNDRILILTEWMHWPRVIRLDSEHLPADMVSFGGDSIGRWEGDTLVVETTNFQDFMSPHAPREGLRVVERFNPIDEGSLLYNFTVHDPTTRRRTRVSSRGGRVTSVCTSTPATRATTRWRTPCAAPVRSSASGSRSTGHLKARRSEGGMTKYALWPSATVFCALLAFAATASEGPATAIVGATLIDGSGRGARRERRRRRTGRAHRGGRPACRCRGAAGRHRDRRRRQVPHAGPRRPAQPLRRRFGRPAARMGPAAGIRRHDRAQPWRRSAGESRRHRGRQGRQVPGAAHLHGRRGLLASRGHAAGPRSSTARRRSPKHRPWCASSPLPDVDFIKMWVDPTMDGRLEWNGGKAPIPRRSARRSARPWSKRPPGTASPPSRTSSRRKTCASCTRWGSGTSSTPRAAPRSTTPSSRGRAREGLSFAPALSKAQDLWYLPGTSRRRWTIPGSGRRSARTGSRDLRAPETLRRDADTPPGRASSGPCSDACSGS